MGDVPPGDNVAINLGGLGDIDMFTGPTLSVMNGLGQAGATFADAWKGILGQINAETAKLTDPALGDTISAEFRQQYNAAEPPLVQAADGVAPQFDGVAGDGRKAVAKYLQTDGHDVPAALRAATGL